MSHKPGPYNVPEHTSFPDMVDSGTQISDTEITIQSAATHAEGPAGTVLSHLAQAQSNLAIAAALREINQTLRETHQLR